MNFKSTALLLTVSTAFTFVSCDKDSALVDLDGPVAFQEQLAPKASTFHEGPATPPDGPVAFREQLAPKASTFREGPATPPEGPVAFREQLAPKASAFREGPATPPDALD